MVAKVDLITGLWASISTSMLHQIDSFLFVYPFPCVDVGHVDRLLFLVHTENDPIAPDSDPECFFYASDGCRIHLA